LKHPSLKQVDGASITKRLGAIYAWISSALASGEFLVIANECCIKTLHTNHWYLIDSISLSNLSLFGDICNGLHDPRIAVEPEKLKLVKIKSLQFPDDKHSTDVDIDYRRASKIYEVNYGPFGQLTPVMLSNFGDFKNTVCNTPHFYPSAFTDKQRIQIAIFFYKSRSFENFRFKATHHIDGNFACMVVQKKLFFVTERGVQEIKDTKSVPHLENENIISVHELAFAQETPSYSDFDPMKPAPGLWFNIPDVILRKTTAYDVKQITLENKKFDLSSEETDFFDTYCTHVSNPERPFYVFYTRRGDSSGIYDLIIQTLCHAVGVDRLALTSPKEKFQSAKRALQLDYWPASAGKLTNSISSDNIGYAAREYSLRDKDEKKMMYDSFCSNLDGGQSSYTTGSTNGRSRFVDLFDELADQKYIQE